MCPVESERGLRWLRVFPGTLAQVGAVRQFVACLLEECPARDALVSCASELAANAVVHTGSGRGGCFTVEVSCPRTGVVRVSVTDEGGPAEPAAALATHRVPWATAPRGWLNGGGAA